MRKVKSVVLFLMLAGAMSADAEIVLSKVFSDNMVLQREMPVPVWGWGEPGEKVTVKFKDQEKTAIADTDGKWIVRLDPLKASAEAQAMTISSSKITQSPDRSIAQSPNLQISNILVGDVWLCSGQSNMEFPVKESANATEDISHANYPLIRLLTVAHKSIPVPQNFIESTGWTACTPKDVPGFSAVGYFFGRKLFQELNIPIGLINSSRGGSAIETWTPPDGFANRSEIDKLVKEHKSLVTLDDKKKFMEKLCREDQFVASRYPQVKGQLPSWPEEKVIDYVLSDSYYTYKE
ncbi:MAG: hypothetical protein NT118_09840, partial [Lentisphaerae bacterium]|nr:hypothetical protein [Lentisphaerota bacterium]